MVVSLVAISFSLGSDDGCGWDWERRMAGNDTPTRLSGKSRLKPANLPPSPQRINGSHFSPGYNPPPPAFNSKLLNFGRRVIASRMSFVRVEDRVQISSTRLIEWVKIDRTWDSRWERVENWYEEGKDLISSLWR
jgi:hypothetical protein